MATRQHTRVMASVPSSATSGVLERRVVQSSSVVEPARSLEKKACLTGLRWSGDALEHKAVVPAFCFEPEKTACFKCEVVFRLQASILIAEMAPLCALSARCLPGPLSPRKT